MLKRLPAVLVGLLMILYIAQFGVLSIQRHDAFQTHMRDLGNMDQPIWNTLHGRLLDARQVIAHAHVKNRAQGQVSKAQDAVQDVDLYRKRSPAWNAAKLRTPLLIHTTTNDRDVNVVEVEHLIAQLKAAGKKFEYKVYEDFPGGHSMNRIDTLLARESRKEVWAFLAKHLKP